MIDSNLRKAICFTLIATFPLAIMGVFVKLIGSALPNSMVLFSRFFVSFIILLPVVIREPNFSFRVKSPFILLARCLVGLISMGLYFYSIRYLRLVDAILLINTAPIFVPIVIYLFTGIKTHRSMLYGILISFIGLIIILRPTGDMFHVGSLLGLNAGILAAVAYVLLKMFLTRNDNNPTTALFYYFLICTIIPLLASPFGWSMPSLIQILMLLGVGFFGALY